MIDNEKWDKYYDGDISDELEYIPEDCILYEKDNSIKTDRFDEVLYFGPKTNATVKQIKYNMHVKERNDKFLYADSLVVILLDYSKGIIDKWKKGTILYCYGEQTYSKEGDIDNLSLIDRMIFGAGASGDTTVYAFWKDEKKNYSFINGVLVLNQVPYQIKEDNKFRWVFPLSIISNVFYSMPDKYSFNIDVKKVNRLNIKNENKQDAINMIEFNDSADFSTNKRNIKYRQLPQKKNNALSEIERNRRSRQVAENALCIAEFKCEIDKEHPTFIRKRLNLPYTEAHHLVPLGYSECFDWSLDVEENVVSLCSTCHNQIHYGKDAEVLIKKLYASRKELLKQAGIVLSEQELLEMYEIY